jgi:hypothetical protein
MRRIDSFVADIELISPLLEALGAATPREPFHSYLVPEGSPEGCHFDPESPFFFAQPIDFSLQGAII